VSALAATLGAVLLVMGALWLASLRLKDSSIVDLFWGLGFVLVAWLSLSLHGPSPRGWLVCALVTVWGVRLSAYLTWRNHGRGEDPRYAAMRAKAGPAWPLRSLLVVFGLQGVLLWLISMPVQLAIRSLGALTWLDGISAALVLVGVTFETVGDLQLARFKASPANKGQLITTGLWRYTRHPNYFGDAVTWWGLAGFGLACGAWPTLLSAGLMTFLLVRVSGVPMLESAMKHRPGYAEYVARTSAFIPMPPRRLPRT
jgi:steroid 5-alpha reductase family enzyme